MPLAHHFLSVQPPTESRMMQKTSLSISIFERAEMGPPPGPLALDLKRKQLSSPADCQEHAGGGISQSGSKLRALQTLPRGSAAPSDFDAPSWTAMSYCAKRLECATPGSAFP